ncbi:MAG: phosphoenolpyruvate-protein phosphotransferase system enzyme [Ilumatobacteraceae bacterium]|jgi:hypothetical protein
MAPMVATADGAREFANEAHAAGLTTVGVMIEIPTAELLAPRILAEVDFVSIGTNDLAQYTFAADRMEGTLAAFLDPWQPALLSLIAMCAQAESPTTSRSEYVEKPRPIPRSLRSSPARNYLTVEVCQSSSSGSRQGLSMDPRECQPRLSTRTARQLRMKPERHGTASLRDDIQRRSFLT